MYFKSQAAQIGALLGVYAAADFESGQRLTGLFEFLGGAKGADFDVMTDLTIGQGDDGDAWITHAIHDHLGPLVVSFGITLVRASLQNGIFGVVSEGFAGRRHGVCGYVW